MIGKILKPYKKSTIGWLVRAVLRAALVVFLVTVLVFFLIRLIPGDPAVMVLGEHADEAAVSNLREQLGLNLSLAAQFRVFLSNVFLHGDTGVSIKYGVSCRELILQYIPVTFALTGFSMLLTIIFSITLSLFAATHKDGLVDHVIRTIPSITHGMPAFWIGILLIMLFSVKLSWFPAGNLKEGFLGGLYSLCLPAMTIALTQTPSLVRSLREQLLEVLESDFVVTLKAMQIPKRRILLKHVLRNAFVPTLMLFSVNLSYMVGGTLVVEQVFAIRGIGKLLFTAISNRDFPLVQGIALYCAVLVVLISLLTDIIAHFMDRRTAKGGK